MQAARNLNEYNYDYQEMAGYDNQVEFVLYENLDYESPEMISEQRLKKTKALLLFFVGISLFAVISYVYLSSMAIINMEQGELISIQNEINVIEQKTAELNEKIELDLSIDDLEVYAVERLGMIKAEKDNVVVLNDDYDLVYNEENAFNIEYKIGDVETDRPLVLFGFANRLTSIFN